MKIRIATFEDAELISKLANEIWPKTYAGILSNEQILFMLADFYTVSSIENQLENGHLFFILQAENSYQGFASITQQSNNTYKLQKLYIHQKCHGKGYGKLLITHIENYCKSLGVSTLLLNVNRANKAKFFYDKMDYQIVETIDIPYHHFVLNDYVMAKNLIP